jgi:outer membrane protein assembly factor BamB
MGFDAAQILAIRPNGEGDVSSSHVAWRFGKGAPSKPSMLLVDDLLYTVNDAGITGAIDAKTGELVWRGRVDGTYSASPLYAAGRIYTFSEDGKTTVLAAGREFKVLAENFLEDGFMASPAVDGKALFLRTRTHVYRIEE